jgi:asparagine synthase (glutamine-hydrolysing)
LSARPFLARLAADAGRPEGAERLRRALEGDAIAAAAIATPGLELAWHAAAGAEAPGSARVICVIDGSIFGLEDLAAELDVDGDEATVLARAYERLGEAVLDRVHGAFAVFLWDREARTGLVARDQLGGRPVHHRPNGSGHIVGSEVRDLLALSTNPPEPDRVAIAHWLARRPAPDERTLFTGVSRLRAGHLIRLGNGRADTWRWWEPRYSDPQAIGREDAAGMLRDAMAGAVARALRGAAAPGIMLSGGLDSACVAGFADSLRAPARAYSQVFPAHPRIDESQSIEVLTRRYGLAGHTLSYAGGSALAAADEYARAWALPPSSPNWFVWEPLYDLAREDGVDVMLDGEGGDELFGCSPRLLADLLKSARVRELVSQARRIPGMGPDPRPRRIMRAISLYGVRAVLPRALHARLRQLRRTGGAMTPWLSPDARALLGSDAEQDAWKALAGPRWWAALTFSLVEAPDRMGAQDEAGRSGGRNGFDVAHPWRDLKLVELMLSLPPQLSFDPDLDRPLARAAVRGMLPESVRLSGHKPFFNELLDQALAGADADELSEVLGDPGGAVAWALRPGGLAAITSPSRSLVIWRIASASLWARRVFG